MIVYLPVATGHMLCLEGTRTILSAKAFTDKAQAEQYIPEFKAKATEDRGGICEIDPKTVTVSIVEIVLVSG